MGGLPPDLEPSQDVVALPQTTDEARVASYYAASDIYALPSLQDNLPNTVSESLCCGTPVAAFPTGGIVEMIEPGINGDLSQTLNAASFADTIRQVCNSRLETTDSISKAAHEMYSPSRIASLHLNFFANALRSPAPHA
jgi:glycosyltransferase involved in cell wall biosynthesis